MTVRCRTSDRWKKSESDFIPICGGFPELWAPGGMNLRRQSGAALEVDEPAPEMRTPDNHTIEPRACRTALMNGPGVTPRMDRDIQSGHRSESKEAGEGKAGPGNGAGGAPAPASLRDHLSCWVSRPTRQQRTRALPSRSSADQHLLGAIRARERTTGPPAGP